ncbi:MAG TPA: type II toxin-antitoxin system Phd/YefM family antitoxin [Solirubrobacteraceae bacterium]
MLPVDQMSLADIKNHLSEVVERIEREHGRVLITKHGRPAAVVLSIEDLDSLEETLDVLSSAALMDDVRAGMNDAAVVLTKDQALDLTKRM